MHLPVSGPVRALGAISGTSMDGIDVALVETDGEAQVSRLGGRTLPYPDDLRADLLEFLTDAGRAECEPLDELEARVTAAFADAIHAFLADAGPLGVGIDLIGLHGQTVWHRPERRFTRQLGRGDVLARRFGIDVVDRFRHADVAAGGEGAPLAPLYHAALATGLAQPLVMLNLGGVGNLTYVDGATILAFDTGPASALIDDYVRRHCGLAYDAGGAIGRSGRADRAVVERFLRHPFFAALPPKSLDRQAFHAVMAEVEAMARAEDAVATLTAMTVAATAAATAHLPLRPVRWLVTGGGRHNAGLMAGLRTALGVPVEPVEAAGFDGDLMEAECFGYLAVRGVRGLPLSLPTTTGVPRPMPGGVWHRAGGAAPGG